MREDLQQLGIDLSEAVQGDEALAFIFDVTDHDVLFVFSALESLDTQHPDALFLSFAHAFEDETSYLRELVSSVITQHEAVNHLRTADGLPPWPDLPEAFTDERQPGPQRLRQLITYIRDQLPAEDDARLILTLLPSHIGDPQGYGNLIRGLLPSPALEPWMAFTRLFVRDDRSARFLTDLVEHEDVIFYDGLDFSPEATASNLVHAAHAPETPESERMMALTQLAALDFSYRRYDESIRKWAACYAYYDQAEIISMKGLCVCGVADVLREAGKPREAKDKYQQGLALPMSQETLPVVLNLLLGICRTCILLKDWEDAEGYLAMTDQLASHLCQAYPKCEAMERQGYVYYQQKRFGEARTRWRAAIDLTKELEIYDIAERALTHTIAMFEEARMRPEQREHEQELAQLRATRQAAEHQASAKGSSI